MCAWGIRVIEGRQFSLHAYLYSVTHSAKRQNITLLIPQEEIRVCSHSEYKCQMEEQNRKGWTAVLGNMWIWHAHMHRGSVQRHAHIFSLLSSHWEIMKERLSLSFHPSLFSFILSLFPSLSSSQSSSSPFASLGIKHWDSHPPGKHPSYMSGFLFYFLFLDSLSKLPMLLSILCGPS